jgi:hypothetical protein
MKRIVPALLCTIAASVSAQSLQFHGFLTAREIYVKAQPSWTTGGFGRFDVGAANADDHRYVNIDVAQLGVDWTPWSWFLVHADGVARKEQSGTIGKHAGVVQAFIDLHTEHLRLRAGNFWLPTSRENIEPLWTSPYSITFSALNTWIGQEVRPIGADLQYSPNFYITLGGTAFRGNDTMGSELASRGWTFGNRLSVYDEVIADVPDTTRPIGPEIDHRIGDSERLRLQLPERAMIQFARVDNRTQLLFRRPPDQPWRTKFNVISADAGASSPTTLAAEWLYGTTTVGFPGGSFQLRFDTAYALLSHKSGMDRWTARVERFKAGREHGHAYTIAWLRETSPHIRSGIEYVRATGNQPLAPEPRTGGSTITIELRYRF